MSRSKYIATEIVPIVSVIVAAASLYLAYLAYHKPDPDLAPTVCGTWKSSTSDKIYDFRCSKEGVFSVFEATAGDIKPVGDGVQIGYSVTANIDVPKDGLLNRVFLKFNVKNANELEGEFRFTDAKRTQEGGLKFVRIH